MEYSGENRENCQFGWRFSEITVKIIFSRLNMAEIASFGSVFRRESQN